MFNLNIIDVLLFISAILTLLLAGVMFFRNPRNKVNVFYGLAVFFASTWTFGIAMFRLSDFSKGYFWMAFYYISAALIAINYLYFVINFLNNGTKKLGWLKHISIYLPLVITLLIIFLNIKFIDDYKIEDREKIVKLGIGYFVYMLYFASYMTSSFIILWKRILKKTGVEKTQLKFVLFGSIGTTIPASVFNLFLPIFTYEYIWLGPYFTLVMVVAIAYAILKHGLLDIKIIVTELLAFSIWIFVLIRTLLSENPKEWLINGSLLLFVIISGILLIRSVLKEVKTREEMEKLAWELEQANIKLKELDKAKSDFVTITSHQLRTPITAIKGYASMVLEGSFGAVPGKAKVAIDRIFQSSNRLVALINDFLNLSRIERGKMEYVFAKVNLKEIIENVFDEFKIINAKKKVPLDLSLKIDGGEFNANADPDKIRQTIYNLVDNAIKYTTKGFVKISLYKDASEGSGEKAIIMKVEDSGKGMSKETLDNIFEKFARARDDGKKYRVDGTGLGLYVAREIARAHGGDVWAESAGLGKGSVFYMKLPVKKV